VLFFVLAQKAGVAIACATLLVVVIKVYMRKK